MHFTFLFYQRLVTVYTLSLKQVYCLNTIRDYSFTHSFSGKGLY